jgi:hypothetical protein
MKAKPSVWSATLSTKRIVATSFVFLLVATLLLFGLGVAYGATDHSFLSSYEGSKTCKSCHSDEVGEISHSLHYRFLGEVQGVYNMFTNKPVTGEHGKGNRY